MCYMCKSHMACLLFVFFRRRLVVGNPNENPYVCSFLQPGTWTVKCQVKDKDMDDWSEQSYSVGVEVGQPKPEVAVEVNGAAVEFETAEDGKTRTAAVAAGTMMEDIKVIVGGVDVTKGFKVDVAGTTATIAFKNPFEMPREEVGSGVVDNSAWTDNGDGNVTLNVGVVPGLYYAADSAATIEALKRPGAAEPAKAGDAVVAPKQEGAQGFYKVWVSDSPMEAE